MAATSKIQPNMRSEIRIADFNFDINGDGTLDPFEKAVMKAFKDADRDGSGTLTAVEMLDIMRKMAEGKKAEKRMGRSVMGLIALVFMLIIALVGVSISGAMVGGEAIKESKVPDCSDPAVAAISGTWLRRGQCGARRRRRVLCRLGLRPARNAHQPARLHSRRHLLRGHDLGRVRGRPR